MSKQSINCNVDILTFIRSLNYLKYVFLLLTRKKIQQVRFEFKKSTFQLNVVLFFI